MIRTAVALLLSVTLVSACGWHLRGTLALPEGLDRVYLNSQPDARVLSGMLQDLLAANQVDVVDSPAAAQMVINLLSYREERRVVSIGDNTLVTEYELIAQAEFSIEDAQGNTVLPPSDASVVRAYQFDQDNVLGKAEEERLIREEMRRELAQQIIRRLRFLNLENEASAPAVIGET